MTTTYTSPLPDVEIPEAAVTDYVFRNAGTHPDRVAMIDGATGAGHTFADLLHAIRALAGGLVARGLEPGAVVALWRRTCRSSQSCSTAPPWRAWRRRR